MKNDSGRITQRNGRTTYTVATKVPSCTPCTALQEERARGKLAKCRRRHPVALVGVDAIGDTGAVSCKYVAKCLTVKFEFVVVF